ncbi:MAG: lysylphosphatidylglycerol synthase transmembrane domain-containing protein [Dehalococcoidia bacterium]
MRFGSFRNRLLLSVGLGLAVVIGLLVYGDFSGVVDSLKDFRWSYVPIILGLTLFNYALRFVKWDYYLRLTGIRHVPKWDSLLIFFAGLSMTITPGKVGEWIKSYFLKERFGAPVSRTAPILVAERLTDGFAMILLAAGGLALVHRGWLVLLAAAVAGVLLVTALRYRPVVRWTIGAARRFPFARRHTRFIVGFYQSAFILLSPKPLLIAIAIGFVSWLGEGVALYYVLLGLGAENGWELVIKGAFILSITTLAGALFLAPGGLGVAEGGIAGLTQVLTTLPREAAAAGALLIRLCTLWFGVALGIVALVALTRRMGTVPIEKPAPMAETS